MKLSQLVVFVTLATILVQSTVFAQETPEPTDISAEKSSEKSSQTPASSVDPTAEKSSQTPEPTAPTAEKSSEKPASSVASTPEKKYSIGPVVEFGSSTAFGITTKFTLSDQISVRPMILFGYKPTVSRSNTSNIALQAGVTPAQINSSAGQQFSTDIINNTGTGTGYGLAVTYDLKLPDSKMVGYIGPKILFASSSGSGTGLLGVYTTNTNETNVGLTAGADYDISPDVTVGFSATYNVFRSGTTSVTTQGRTLSDSISGGNFNMGVNVMYDF